MPDKEEIKKIIMDCLNDLYVNDIYLADGTHDELQVVDVNQYGKMVDEYIEKERPHEPKNEMDTKT